MDVLWCHEKANRNAETIMCKVSSCLHIYTFTCLLSPLPLLHLRFYMYKLPKEHGRKAPYLGEFYLLLEKGSDGWTNGKGTVNDTTGALGRTVGQLYSQGKVCRRHSHKHCECISVLLRVHFIGIHRMCDSCVIQVFILYYSCIKYMHAGLM